MTEICFNETSLFRQIVAFSVYMKYGQQITHSCLFYLFEQSENNIIIAGIRKNNYFPNTSNSNTVLYLNTGPTLN